MSGLPTRIEGYRRRAEDARSGPLRRTAATGNSPACHVLLHRYLSLAGPVLPRPWFRMLLECFLCLCVMRRVSIRVQIIET